MKKLRLVLFEQCNRRCKGCCNKDWNIKSLPVCTDYTGWDVIMLTGGEPMLMPGLVLLTIGFIRTRNPKAKVYVYTPRLTTPRSSWS
jgi:molybdenum cofactor biosynthesis enzyme MoaA